MVNVPYDTLADPSPTAPPVIFEPPPDLTGGRFELWIIAGGGEHWGGCEIWGSVNNDSYDKVGIISPGAVIGSLATILPSGSDPDTSSACTVDVALSQGTLFPGAQSDADKLVTLCWVGGELVAYSAARLTAPYLYALDGYLRRGCLGTAIAEHPAGTRFARLNQAVFRFEYPPHLAGSTIHIKLPAFNPFNQMLEGLDRIPSYSTTLRG
jgi:hypothetical protein